VIQCVQRCESVINQMVLDVLIMHESTEICILSLKRFQQ